MSKTDIYPVLLSWNLYDQEWEPKNWMIFKIISFAAELGDYDEETHTAAFISEFRFVQNQNEEFEFDVLEAYKKIRYLYMIIYCFQQGSILWDWVRLNQKQ